MSIPKADREFLQFFIDHHNDDITSFATIFGEVSDRQVRRKIDDFCTTYKCGVRVQVSNWERIGLHTFFVLSAKPANHPYAIRQFKMIGESVCYLIQYVAPDPHNLPLSFDKVYPVSHIYCKNNTQFLYQEPRTPSLTEEWLLTLKEVMIEQEVGHLVWHPPAADMKSPISITPEFLDRLSKAWTWDGLGRIHQRHVEFIQSNPEFLETYLNLNLPGTANYILILNKTLKPSLFTGGLINLFPLVEIYEGENVVICRFQLFGSNFSRLHTTLYLFLQEICTPYLYSFLEETRFFRLGEQWRESQWDNFVSSSLSI